MENAMWYSVPKTAKAVNDFLELFWGFHDFRIYSVKYLAGKDRIDLILQYDSRKLKVLLRFEGCAFMNFVATGDYEADWMFGADIRFDESNNFVWISSDEYSYDEDIPAGIFWVSGRRLSWTVVDESGNPIPFSFEKLHPGWIKDKDVASGEYEINKSLYPQIESDGEDSFHVPFSCVFGSVSLSIQDLIQNYPPKFKNRTKAEFYEKALDIYKNQEGKIFVTQCTFNGDVAEKNIISLKPIDVQTEKSFFNYAADSSSETRSVWYLNYADANLFGFYGSDLFAQDEIQTLEHPLLCSVREYLLRNKIRHISPNTTFVCHEHCFPAPVLIENVPYWISVNTSPVLDDGHAANLYGNNFASARSEKIEAGIKVFDGSVTSNIIAVAAISSRKHLYNRNQIDFTFKTALCAFEKARFLSVAHNPLDENLKVVIHTGNWGCGVFGGDKEFMYLVQIIAASAVGIDEIVFHAVDEDLLASAKKKFSTMQETSFASCVDYLHSQNYKWNSGDGN